MAALWMWPTDETRQDAASTKRGLIKEAKPALPSKPVEEKKKVEVKKLEDGRLMKYVNGEPVWKTPKIDYGVVETNKVNPENLPIEYRVFRHSADRKIAGLLLIEPGTEIIGDEGSMFRDFDKKLLKSITEPIIISEDDSEEVKELKRAVREAKIDLKARMDAGEDIGKTMSDTWHQLQELGLYREELRKEVAKYAHDKNISKEDMEDFVKAANTMLEQRGGMPITMPEFYKHRLELREARQKLLNK